MFILTIIFVFISWPVLGSQYRADFLDEGTNHMNANIRHLVQDATGRIWVGTENGLYVHDGVRVRRIPSPKGRSVVQNIQTDQLGRIWVDWLGFSYSVFDPRQSAWLELAVDHGQSYAFIDRLNKQVMIDEDYKTPEFLMFNEDLHLSPLTAEADHHIKTHLLDVYQVKVTDHELMVSSLSDVVYINEGFGVYELIQFTGTFEFFESFIAHNDALFVCTNLGIYAFQSGVMDLIHAYPGTMYRDFSNNHCQLSGSVIYYRLDPQGLEGYDLTTGQVVLIRDEAFRDLPFHKRQIRFQAFDEMMVVASTQKIIIADEQGVHQIKMDQDTKINDFSPILVTKDRTILIGTDGEGLIKVSQYGTKFTVRQSPFVHHRHHRKAVDVGNVLWLGNNEGGITRWDRENNDWSIHRLEDLTFNSVRAITKDHNDNIWAATSRGDLMTHDQANNRFEVVLAGSSYQSGINVLLHHKGVLYFEAGSQFHAFDVQTRTLNQIQLGLPFQSLYVKALAVTADDHLLIGTHGEGLIMADATGQVVHHIRDELSSKYIFSVSEDDHGVVWIGTWGGGLYRMDPASGQLQNFSTVNSVVDDTVFGVIPTDDAIWFSTYSGLFQLQGCQPSAWPCDPQIIHYTKADGLQANEFDAEGFALLDSGELYFAGLNGFTVFDPAAIQYNPTPPEPGMLTIEVDGERVDHGVQPISIPHDFNDLTITFSAFNFHAVNKNQYRYRLNDEAWITVDQPIVELNQLSHKPHTIWLDASNNDGVWSTKPLSLDVIVRKPWYVQWPFIFAAITGVFLMFYVVDRYRTRRLRVKTETLEKEVTKRTLRIEQQKREIKSSLDKLNRLYSSISHELRTPLTILLGPINEMRKNHTVNDRQLEVMERQASILKHFINNLLNFSVLKQQKNIRFGAHQVKPYLVSLVKDFQYITRQKNISLSLVDEMGDQVSVRSFKRSLNIIMSNLLENSIKQTPCGGTIVIRSRQVDDRVYLTVEDNGPGVPEEKIAAVFDYGDSSEGVHDWLNSLGIGLSLSNEIAQTLGGSIAVRKCQMGGACFELCLPLASDDEDVLIMDDHNVIKHFHIPEDISDEESEANDKQSHLLIVEDNADIRIQLKNQLHKLYNIHLADSAEAGLELVKSQPIDVLICDIMLPGMTGYELIEHIKSDITIDDVVTIVLSAMDETTARLKSLEYEADYHLSKPYSLDELILAINTSLGRKKYIEQKLLFRTLSNELNEQERKTVVASTLERVLQVIDQHYHDKDFKGPEIARSIGMSMSSLQRKLKEETHFTLGEIYYGFRVNKAKQMILDDTSITEVAYRCGFSSQSHLNVKFKKITGMTPTEYKRSK